MTIRRVFMFAACLSAAWCVWAAQTGVAGEANAAWQEIFPGARFVDNGDYTTAMEQNGALLGYCMETQARGYGGVIQVAVGLGPDGNVLKVKVLSCDGETPGLGQKVKEESFLSQFEGTFAFFTKGMNGTSVAKYIDGIASATYSSQGVVDAVNQALAIYSGQIMGGEAR